MKENGDNYEQDHVKVSTSTFPTGKLMLQDMMNIQVCSSSNVSELYFTDEDECTDDPTPCTNGACNNLVGLPYTCTCNSGYVDDGSGQACVGKIPLR